MRTLQSTLDQLNYHPATPEVAATYARLRAIAGQAATDSWDLVPDGPEKTLALRGLQQFLMYSNLAVALTTSADTNTPHIARVLPPDGPQAVTDAPAGVGG